MVIEVGLRTHTVLDALAAPFIYLGVVPCVAIYHAVRYLLAGPRHLKFTEYITLNVRRVMYQVASLGIVPRPDPNWAEIIQASQSGECEVERVFCGPIRAEVPKIKVLEKVEDIVVPRDVPAFMIRTKEGRTAGILAHAEPGERIVLFIPGGGYTGGHPLGLHTSFSSAKITGGRVFGVNYRKSLDDGSAFPGSLLDCLAGYQYLLDLGFEPKNIMLSGDSAGANACLALARYLDDLDQVGFTAWGQVGSMCLHCPWSDMTQSFPSIKTNMYTDHLVDLGIIHIPSHTRHFSTDLTNPYLSPALSTDSHFAHLAQHGVQVYIMGYTTEAFFDEIVALAMRMKEAGVDVTFRETPYGTHSEFVWMDRPWPKFMGWSWPTVKADFEAFWDKVGRGIAA